MLTARVTPSLIRELDAMAERAGLTRTEVVRDILERAVEKERRAVDGARAIRFKGEPPP